MVLYMTTSSALTLAASYWIWAVLRSAVATAATVTVTPAGVGGEGEERGRKNTYSLLSREINSTHTFICLKHFKEFIHPLIPLDKKIINNK